MVPPCVEWCKMDNRATTPLGHCPSTVSLPIRPHCMSSRRNICKEDLNSFPHGELEETTRTSSHHVDEEWRLSSRTWNHLHSPKRSNRLGWELPTLEIDVYIWHYALIVVHAKNEWMNECLCEQWLAPLSNCYIGWICLAPKRRMTLHCIALYKLDWLLGYLLQCVWFCCY